MRSEARTHIFAAGALLVALTIVTSACTSATSPSAAPSLAATPTPAATFTPTAISFRQSFILSEQMIPDQVAIDQGFFSKLGLTVTMNVGTGGFATATQVASGADDIGIAGPADVLVQRSAGADIIGIAALVPHDPSAIVSLSSNPIRTVADLKGKRIASSSGTTSFLEFQAVLIKNGLDINKDVTIVLVAPGPPTLEALMSHQVDGIAQFATTNAPAVVAAGGTPVVVPFSDLGVAVPGNVYVTSRKYADAHPEAVARFLLGIIHGWEYVGSHGVAAGIDALARGYPEMTAANKTLFTARWQYESDNGYLLSSAGPATLESLRFNQDALTALNDVLQTTKKIPGPADLSAAFTNVYLDMAKQLEAAGN
jgi:NitT/TauT family transport system substrate-binding protein